MYVYVYIYVYMYVSIHIDRKRKWNKDKTDICKGPFPEVNKMQNDS